MKSKGMTQDILDAPINLKINNGNNFPPNFVLIAYALLVVSIPLALFSSIIIGSILFILGLLGATNQHIIEINPTENYIHDYSQFIGFIKNGKKYPLDKFKYITTMPLIESGQVYASSSNSTTISNTYTTVTIFGERLRGKIVITKFDSKNSAYEAAIAYADRLNLKYFEYDPKLVRAVLRGEKTL